MKIVFDMISLFSDKYLMSYPTLHLTNYDSKNEEAVKLQLRNLQQYMKFSEIYKLRQQKIDTEFTLDYEYLLHYFPNVIALIIYEYNYIIGLENIKITKLEQHNILEYKDIFVIISSNCNIKINDITTLSTIDSYNISLPHNINASYRPYTHVCCIREDVIYIYYAIMTSKNNTAIYFIRSNYVTQDTHIKELSHDYDILSMYCTADNIYVSCIDKIYVLDNEFNKIKYELDVKIYKELLQKNILHVINDVIYLIRLYAYYISIICYDNKEQKEHIINNNTAFYNHVFINNNNKLCKAYYVRSHLITINEYDLTNMKEYKHNEFNIRTEHYKIPFNQEWIGIINCNYNPIDNSYYIYYSNGEVHKNRIKYESI